MQKERSRKRNRGSVKPRNVRPKPKDYVRCARPTRRLRPSWTTGWLRTC